MGRESGTARPVPDSRPVTTKGAEAAMKPGRLKLVKRAAFGGGLFALAFVLAWVAPPLRSAFGSKTRTYVANGYRIREKTSRNVDVLPAREWGAGRESVVYISVRGTSLVRTHKFGCFALVEQQLTTIEQKLPKDGPSNGK